MVTQAPRQSALPAAIVRQAAEVFHVIGHPDRLRMVELLIDGEMSVNQLAAAIRSKPALTSGHLKTMKAARVVSARREGRYVYYRLTNAHAAGAVNAIRRLYLQRNTFQDGEAI